MRNCTVKDERMLEIYRIIGPNVKRVRTSRKISQLALAIAIGHKAVGTISMAELCTHKKHFNIEHLIKIADVLEVDVTEFFKSI